MNITKITFFQIFIDNEKTNVIVGGECYIHKAKYKYLSSSLGSSVREEDVSLRLASSTEVNDAEHVI